MEKKGKETKNQTDKNPIWWDEAMRLGLEGYGYSYTTQSGENLDFLYHPSRALFDTYYIVRDLPKGKVAKCAFDKAEKIFMEKELTDREKAIASAFFEIGVGFDRAIGLEEIRKYKNNLKKGKEKAIKSRQQISKEKHDKIKLKLEEMYSHGDGFKMSYPSIVRHLKHHNLSTYTEAQTLKLVKKYAPAIKAKYV